MNCWEFKGCGREKGGHREEELGVCPAYPHHGNQCAEVAGTLCADRPAGTFAFKLADCTRCSFFQSPYYSGRSTSQRVLAQMASELKDKAERLTA